MVRELIKPIENKYVLNLPDEMIGKTIEVIAFEVENSGTIDSTLKPVQTIEDIKNRYSQFPVISHEDYKFDRDEANDL